MANIHPSIDSILEPLSAAWNAAEASYKRAEQLGDKTATSSINEVRYAGRKIVEVMAMIKSDSDPKEIEDKIRDIYADIHRAHHDAIDAGIAVIGLRMKAVRDEVPAKIIREAFPEYIDLLAKLGEVQEKIVDSRQDRNARGDIYIEIENGCYAELHALFKRFLACEKLLIAEAKQESEAQAKSNKTSLFQGIAIGAVPGVPAAISYAPTAIEFIKALF